MPAFEDQIVTFDPNGLGYYYNTIPSLNTNKTLKYSINPNTQYNSQNELNPITITVTPANIIQIASAGMEYTNSITITSTTSTIEQPGVDISYSDVSYNILNYGEVTINIKRNGDYMFYKDLDISQSFVINPAMYINFTAIQFPANLSRLSFPASYGLFIETNYDNELSSAQVSFIKSKLQFSVIKGDGSEPDDGAVISFPDINSPQATLNARGSRRISVYLPEISGSELPEGFSEPNITFLSTSTVSGDINVYEIIPFDLSNINNNYQASINDNIEFNIIPLKTEFPLSYYNINIIPNNAISNISINDSNNTVSGIVTAGGSININVSATAESYLLPLDNYKTIYIELPVVRPVLMEGTKVYINPYDTKAIEQLKEGEHILVDNDNMVTAPIVKIYRELLYANEANYKFYDLSENMLGFDHSGVILSSTAIISLGRSKYMQIESTNPDYSTYANNEYNFPNGPTYVYHIQTSSKNRLIYTEAGVAIRTYSSIENVLYDPIINKYLIRNKLIDYFS